MRVCVCFPVNHKPYKLVWLNEDRKGIYVGLYNLRPGGHWSYHRDGTVHYKERPKGAATVVRHLSPISKINESLTLLSSSQSISPDVISRRGIDFVRDEKTQITILLSDASFLPDHWLMLQVHIMHREYESEFMTQARNNASVSLIGRVLFALDNFPAHKLGLSVFSMKTNPGRTVWMDVTLPEA